MIAEQLPECCAGKLSEEWQRGVTAGRVLGYADALDAARKAVEYRKTPCDLNYCYCDLDCCYVSNTVLDGALRAIDALRGEQA